MSEVRLIDANALLAQIPTIEDEYKYVRKLIDDAPAVEVNTCINYKFCELRKECELLSAIEDCED